MSKFNKKMDELFNLPPSVIEPEDNDIIEYSPSDITSNHELSTVLDHDLKTDYERTRDTIDTLIGKGIGAVDDMLEIARGSEKARDFEVAGNMIKTVVDASKELLEIQKKMRELTGVKNQVTQNIKNAVFVGSAKDLIRSIKDENKEE